MLYSCVMARKQFIEGNPLRNLWNRIFMKIFPVHAVHRQHEKYSIDALEDKLQHLLSKEAQNFAL